jgi:lipoyl(octanoyl) transferase
MDLTPFSLINPCGYKGLTVCQTLDVGGAATVTQAQEKLLSQLIKLFGYNNPAPAI